MLLTMLAAMALQQPDPARVVLNATLKAYRDCPSYRDTGSVVSVFEVAGEPSESTTRTTKTWFVRPDHVRFECHEIDAESKVDEYFVVWKGKTGSHTWWSRTANGTHDPEPLQALRAASAISGGASDLLFALMCPVEGGEGWSLAKLEKLNLDNPEVVAGAPCHVLKGLGFAGSEVAVWIDSKTHAIMRYREAIPLEGGRLIDTIDFKPQLGAPVTPEEAWFKPPIVREPPPVGSDTGGGGSR